MKKQVSTAHTLLGVVFTILFSHSSSFAQLPSYVPTDGLVGYWPFNGNAEDESGNGNDGVVNGAVSLTKDRFGEENAAYKFNGDQSFINTNTKPFTSKGLTISCWFSTLSTNEGYVGLVVARNKTNWANGLYLFDNRDCIFYTNNCTSDPRIVHRDPNINKGEWHHYVGIFDGEQLSNYVDGVLTGQSKISQEVCVTDPFLIGDDNCCGRYFIGNLDDVGIWNRALTPEEIEKLFNDSKEYSCDLSDILNPDVNYGSVTDIDGNVYPTVKIGEQEWMADNLRTTRYQNGNLIPNVTDNNEWIKLKTGAWSYYNNDSTLNCPYGKLYNWYAAFHPDNVCPSGWRLPKYSELEVLTDLKLGGVGIAGGKLKSLKLWKEPNVGATNSTGFSALPGGFRSNIDGGGTFGGLENHGWWYFDNNGNPIPRNLDFATESVNPTVAFAFYNLFSKETGVSIRCIKEEDPCELTGSIKPINPRVNQGESVVFDGQLIASAGTTLSWQANTAAVGWSDIHSASTAYTGLFTNKLTIKSAAPGNHLQEIRLVASNGTCFDTSNVATVFIIDTCLVTLTDTILTTVTDTLLIDVVLSSTSTPGSNLIRVYPNPTSSQLVIDAGQYTLMAGYTLTVTAANGSAVWTEDITQPVYTLDLTSWGGKGLYYITLTDPQGKVITTRKIVLQ